MPKLVSLILVVCLLFGCQAKATDTKEINIGYLRVPNDVTIAKEKGLIQDYFATQGITVNFIVIDSGTESNKALASGSLDFATMGSTNGIVALTTGLEVELVWIHEVLGTAEALVVRDSIDQLSDLKGQKIATPFSSTAHYILLNILKEADLTNQVELLDMNTLDIVAAWERGDIAGAYTWEPSLSQLKASGAKVLTDSQQLAEQGYLTANVGLVRQEFAQANPELVAGLLAQLAQAAEIYRTNPTETYALGAKTFGISPAEIKAQMAGSVWLKLPELLSSKYLGTEASPGDFVAVLSDTADFLHGQSFISQVPNRQAFLDFINTKYAERALEIMP